MSQMSVADVAKHLGVSAQRVRDMIRDGQLAAVRVGGRWLIDAASVPAVPRRRGQPYSPRIAWALAELAAGVRPSGLEASELSRLRSRWAKLRGDVAVDAIRSVMARRAAHSRWSAPEPAGLIADPRFVRSGKSDPRSGMAAPAYAEGYVLESDADELIADHMLVPARGAENVTLHISPMEIPERIPLLIVIADLADGGPRERQQATNLLEGMGRDD